MTETTASLPPLTSYAQNFEDVMLWRALTAVENGFYIDVGAQDPVVDSVSLGFYEKGWRGVHVEPTAFYADKLRRARPDEPVIQAAIAETPGLLHFYEIADTGLSTGDAALALQHRRQGFAVRETEVPAMTLDALLDRFTDRDVHWLKIDVEGLEAAVLAGWRRSPVRPWLLVVESVLPGSQVASSAAWEKSLQDKGYCAVHFDGVNCFYLSDDRRELAVHFRSGPNCFDNFVLSGTSTHRFCRLLENRIGVATERADYLQQKLTEQQRATIAAEALHLRLNDLYKTYLEAVHRAELDHKAQDKALQQLSQALETERRARLGLAESERNALALLQQTESDRNDLSTRLQATEFQLEQLLASRSWRLTRPLRVARRALAALKRTVRDRPSVGAGEPHPLPSATKLPPASPASTPAPVRDPAPSALPALEKPAPPPAPAAALRIRTLLLQAQQAAAGTERP